MATQRRVLITGSSRGIGLELARQYLQAGWRVYATCRSPERALDLGRLAASNPDAMSIHPLDVTEQRHIDALAAMLKGTPLDLLINNAGVLGPRLQGFDHTDTDAWSYTFKVNAIAPLKVLEALADNLAASGHGVAAALSSRMGSIADNDGGGYYIYRSSKAALNAVLKSAALDLRERGVTVVALHPGWVRTVMGGPEAELDAVESVTALRRLLDQVDATYSGGFFGHNGERIPW
jgi:NAD(P)-dependent dehydrogenase (short-subunit alcohol dehydrogenase family)